MRYFVPGVALSVLVFIFCGCVATEKLVVQQQQPTRPVEIVYPERVPLDSRRIAADLQLVMAALIEKMRGDRYAVDGVSFAAGGIHEVEENGFRYEGFDLRSVDVTGYEPHVSGNQAQVQAQGLFHFEDVIGRRASALFGVEYNVTRNRIVVERSLTAVVPPVYPRVEAYFVPQREFEKLQENDLKSFAELYLYASIKAIPMQASAEERKQREAYEKMSLWKKMAASAGGQDDYYIIVFCMDRLSSSSELRMKVSNMMGMGGQDIAEVAYRYDAGWRTMIAGGKFNPDSPSTHFYANVQYTLDPEGKTEPILIGSFKNEKDYSPPAEKPKMLAQQSGDPIATGAVFLNPESPQDAIQIQDRLKQLGFYQGSVDGDFGDQSRDALSHFASAAGIAGESIWTLDVQKKLFAEEVALITGPVSSGKTLLDPAVKSDAMLIQSRLKELGHYGGKVDGLFGKGSYQALESYVLSAGLQGSGRWNLDVQKQLFKGTGR